MRLHHADAPRHRVGNHGDASGQGDGLHGAAPHWRCSCQRPAVENSPGQGVPHPGVDLPELADDEWMGSRKQHESQKRGKHELFDLIRCTGENGGRREDLAIGAYHWPEGSISVVPGKTSIAKG